MINDRRRSSPASSQWRTPFRRGAVLVCVLVVLLIVGMMSAQTIQTLLIVRRADLQRGQLRQAQALLELGRMVLARQSVAAADSFEVMVEGRQASIHISKIEPSATSTAEVRYRIVVDYPAGEAAEVTATWESPR